MLVEFRPRAPTGERFSGDAMRKISTQPEKVSLLIAVLLLTGSSGGMCWQLALAKPDQFEIGKGLSDRVVDARALGDKSSAAPQDGDDERVWRAPEPQAAGPEWLYELFTPPAIYRAPESDEFLASLPAAKIPGPERRHPDFDLLEVGPALFRLQLVGFAGEAGNFFGLFENMETTEHFLARVGQEVPALDLKIERLRVIHEREWNPDETSAAEGLVAEALVRDEASGDEIVLTDRERVAHGEPWATIGVRGVTGTRFTLRRNDAFAYQGVRYRLRDLSLSPLMVELAAESPEESDSVAWKLTMPSEGGS